MFKYYNCYYIQ